MTTATTACWADPLTRAERSMLAAMLARACTRSYDARRTHYGRRNITRRNDAMNSLMLVSLEMADLRIDVTERAEVPES